MINAARIHVQEAKKLHFGNQVVSLIKVERCSLNECLKSSTCLSLIRPIRVCDQVVMFLYPYQD